LKRFDYFAPVTLPEALEVLAHRPEAAPLAGGTNILVQVKEGHRSETALLSLTRLPELAQITYGDDPAGGLVIGAAVTMKRIASDPWIQGHYPALATAASLIGSVQTRNMATVGGNLCNASPSADTAPPLLAFDAQAVLVSTSGERVVPLAGFFVGPGVTVLRQGELLKELIIPGSAAQFGSAYVRHIPRAAMDISVVGVAAAVVLEPDQTIGQARIALGAVAPTPMRALAAESRLAGRQLDDRLLAEAGSAAAGEAQPVDDVRASIAYRRHLVNVLTQEALSRAFENARTPR
jgi:carbon-monoxide dehydrogenase medium subunit